MPDGVPGIVKVVVSGGDEEEIKRVIEETRAAGVRVEFYRPKSVYLDAYITVVYREERPSVDRVEKAVRDYVSRLDIGEDVIFSRIVSEILRVPYVFDVSEIRFKVYKGEEVVEKVNENIELSSEEKAFLRNVAVSLKKYEGGKIG